MISANFSVSFKARNKEIRDADDLARRVNRLYPRISSTAIDCSKNAVQFPDLAKKARANVKNVRENTNIELSKNMDFYHAAERILDITDTFEYGNCSESAYLAQIFAKLNGIKNTEFASLEDSKETGLDHAVILVKSKKPYIIDCWLGFADYLPRAFERYNKEFRHCFDLKTDNYEKMKLDNPFGLIKELLSQSANETEIKDLKTKYDTFPKYNNIKDCSGWIIIQSKNKDKENYRTNINTLKQMWGQRSKDVFFDIVKSLRKNDFHIYIEKGQPKIVALIKDNEILQLQGGLSVFDDELPKTNLKTLRQHIKQQKLALTEVAKQDLKEAEKIENEINRIKKSIGKKAINEADAKKILPHFGINVKEDKNGMLTVSEYHQPTSDFTIKDLGIDEEKMFEKIVKIEEDADFSNSQLTSLKNLKSIGGSVTWGHRDINGYSSKIKDLGKLEYIGKHADFENSIVENLGNLKIIKGIAQFDYSMVTDLGELKEIGLSCNFENSKIKSLGKLEKIGSSARFCNSKIKCLGELKYIGSFADFQNSMVEDLGKLEYIGGNAYIEGSRIRNLNGVQVKGYIM